jgi:hypothetical protein
MAVVDRYHIGAIVSVAIEDTRAGREWQDMIAAKQIEVVEAGLGMGIEDSVALMLNEGGWVKIDVGTTSIGIGSPPADAHVDVIVLDGVTDEVAMWLKTNPLSIVVAQSPVEPERLIEGIAFVSAETRSAELIFDGTQWEVSAAP